jgi:hypothetical protein
MKKKAAIFITINIVFLFFFSLNVFSFDKAFHNSAITMEENCRKQAMSSWSESEKWVWEQVCLGQEADLEKEYGKRTTLSVTFFKDLLLKKPWKELIPHNGISISGANFLDDLNLDNFVKSHEIISF